MKFRRTFSKDDFNYQVLEDAGKIIVRKAPKGVIIDHTAIESFEFNTISEYEKFKEELSPEKEKICGSFKKVKYDEQ
jgi:hypothetical protein